MDITKEFADMCGAAGEVQHLLTMRKSCLTSYVPGEEDEEESGDHFYRPSTGKRLMDGEKDGSYERTESDIWIPTRIQITGMMGMTNKVTFTDLVRKNITRHDKLKYYNRFNSVEQTTFAFLMENRWHKLWEDEDGKWHAIEVKSEVLLSQKNQT